MYRNMNLNLFDWHDCFFTFVLLWMKDKTKKMRVLEFFCLFLSFFAFSVYSLESPATENTEQGWLDFLYIIDISDTTAPVIESVKNWSNQGSEFALETFSELPEPAAQAVTAFTALGYGVVASTVTGGVLYGSCKLTAHLHEFVQKRTGLSLSSVYEKAPWEGLTKFLKSDFVSHTQTGDNCLPLAAAITFKNAAEFGAVDYQPSDTGKTLGYVVYTVAGVYLLYSNIFRSVLGWVVNSTAAYIIITGSAYMAIDALAQSSALAWGREGLRAFKRNDSSSAPSSDSSSDSSIVRLEQQVVGEKVAAFGLALSLLSPGILGLYANDNFQNIFASLLKRTKDLREEFPFSVSIPAAFIGLIFYETTALISTLDPSWFNAFATSAAVAAFFVISVPYQDTSGSYDYDLIDFDRSMGALLPSARSLAIGVGAGVSATVGKGVLGGPAIVGMAGGMLAMYKVGGTKKSYLLLLGIPLFVGGAESIQSIAEHVVSPEAVSTAGTSMTAGFGVILALNLGFYLQKQLGLVTGKGDKVAVIKILLLPLLANGFNSMLLGEETMQENWVRTGNSFFQIFQKFWPF